MDRFGIRLVALGIALLAAACRTSSDVDEVYRGPDVTAGVDHFAGTPISGPQPEGALDEAGAGGVTVTFIALERFPEDALLPASSVAHLIVSPGDERAVLSAGRLSRGMRFGSGPEAEAVLGPRLESGDLGRHALSALLRGVVAPGVTARFSLTGRDERRVDDLPDPVRPRLIVLVTPVTDGDGALILALTVEGLVSDEEPDDLGPVASPEEPEAPPAPRPRILRDETVLLRVPAGETAVAALTSPFDETGKAGIAIRVERRAPPDGSAGDEALFRDALARARRDVDESAREARTRPPATSVWPGAGGALDADDRTPFRRRALAFLARATGAALAEDVALGAPDSIIDAVADRVRPILLESGDADRTTFGWLFEAAAWRVLAGATTDPDAVPGLAATLVRHAGEAGRHPDLLVDLVDAADGAATLSRRLVEENLIFLEDSDPGARIRAFDWLSARGEAPEGYRPLASRKERRAAIMRALDKAEDGEASR